MNLLEADTAEGTVGTGCLGQAPEDPKWPTARYVTHSRAQSDASGASDERGRLARSLILTRAGHWLAAERRHRYVATSEGTERVHHSSD